MDRWALAASEGRFDDITDAPDYVFVDHRRHGSGEVTGSAPGRRVLQTVHDNALERAVLVAHASPGSTTAPRTSPSRASRSAA